MFDDNLFVCDDSCFEKFVSTNSKNNQTSESKFDVVNHFVEGEGEISREFLVFADCEFDWSFSEENSSMIDDEFEVEDFEGSTSESFQYEGNWKK